MAKKNNPYFQDFITMIEYSCQAAEFLDAALSNFNPETLPQQREDMHKIEHAADEIRHALMRRLAKEFVPPINREDIVKLSSELDTITDKIEDILIRIYMYNVKTIIPDALLFTNIIVRCCKALQQAVAEFPDANKSKLLVLKIIEVNSIEEEGDAIYVQAVRRLYESGMPPIETAVWSTLFDLFEDCCDVCEHVADGLGSIVMNNS